MKHEESQLQRACKMWYDMQYPQRKKLCFAVPNGGRRDAREARSMRLEGVEAGVADMILIDNGGKAVFIEFKTPKGKQSQHQVAFETAVTNNGNDYYIVRTFEDFVNVVKSVL